MNIYMKKLLSIIVVTSLSASQIACAPKVAKISTPMEQVTFDKNYKYKVELNSGESLQVPNGTDIQGKPNQLMIVDPSKEQSISVQDIRMIEGTSLKRNGSYAKLGLGIGAAFGFAGGAAMGWNFFQGFCEGFPDSDKSECGKNTAGEIVGGVLLFGTIWGGVGALLGLGIGALLPKYNKVQITPVVSPTTSGINTGVNVGLTF